MIKNFYNQTIKSFFASRKLIVELLFHFLIIQIITAISIACYSYYKNSQAIVEFSKKNFKQESNNVVQKINNSFKAIENTGEIIANSINSETDISFVNKSLTDSIVEMLKKFKIINQIYIGSNSGQYLEVSKTQKHMYKMFDKFTLISDSVDFAVNSYNLEKKTNDWFYLSNDLDLIEQEQDSNDETHYDCREREWYKQAIDSESKIWTKVFSNRFNNKIAINYSVPCFSKNGSVLGVLSVSFLLDDIIKSLGEQNLTGSILLVNKDRKILATNNLKLFSNNVFRENNLGQKELLELNETNNELVKTALQKKDQTNNDKFVQYEFTHDKKLYLVSFQKTIENILNLEEIVSIVCVDDFIKDLTFVQLDVLFFSIIITLLSILRIVRFSRKISQPILKLKNQANFITELALEDCELSNIDSQIQEIKDLQHAMSNMKMSLKAFTKFLPKSLVKRLTQKGTDIKVGGKHKNVSILFTDIKNSTTLAQMMPADKFAEHLSEYFEEITSIIHNHHGTIDKYIGDSVMAFWNAPNTDKNHVKNACVSALLCQKKINELNLKWTHEEKPPFITRIGIHTGDVIVGNIGSSDKLNYTIIGDNVNIASRLEGTNKMYSTMINVSQNVIDELGKEVIARPIDFVEVKGSLKALKIYELVALLNADSLVLPSEKQINFTKDFSKAFDLYFSRFFNEAISHFEDIIKNYGPDFVTSMYIDRCNEFIKNPPPNDWNGINHLTQK